MGRRLREIIEKLKTGGEFDHQEMIEIVETALKESGDNIIWGENWKFYYEKFKMTQ